MLKRLFYVSALFVCLAPLFVGCGDGGSSDADLKAYVENYAALVYANYQEVETGLKALQKATDELVANPSEATLKAAKDAWLKVRDPYGQTEVYRFYAGPIDDDRGLEGRINPWPIDENFIDYVKDNDKAGIINDTTTYPTIDESALTGANEKGGEKNISLGFHAIEFLLWGQDFSETTPGTRPYTDYVTDGSGTASNQERRGQYLKLVVSILLKDFQDVMKEWTPDTSGNFRDKFVNGDVNEALKKILTGMGKLSNGELAGERMTTPYNEKDQEEEHSCFSDNTRADILNNAMGVQNVYLGKYGSVSGKSLDDLVRAKDATLADKLKSELEATVTAIKAIPNPFDQAIVGDDSADGRKKVKAAIDALKAQAVTIAAVAKLFNITVVTELED
ncbi:MAG TPA: iron-regulated protein [Myxococcales bacterium]|nr:iron-regulated protein [Deltaproteobacteria bacterium]MBU54559.1 iron-regulated protein [Deltaproteobacteria bacterium]HAA55258.1 iron-regulated protein [Myxococcales bacterium]|tara:strand:- start:25437 stop:26612 length:1176 start_codon:yes stop_codon:yes gene_type:complete